MKRPIDYFLDAVRAVGWLGLNIWERLRRAWPSKQKNTK
jgi:hypothetical protein